ncbi:MAG: MBL fold metallo-hydrolase [Actinomycetota bacterium]|jgi:ribonuclease Z
MATTVTLTGTGLPNVAPGRAGAGVFVKHNDIVVQFDAGRATCNRLIEAGLRLADLDAVFLTHIHSDHVFGLAELVLSRWIETQFDKVAVPLPVITPSGGAARFVQRMLEPFDEDIHLRREHAGSREVVLDAREFPASFTPSEVWASEDRSVVVDAVAVHHEPVPDAVAYRVTTPDGSVVISGDTRVCQEVEDFSRNANVLVHEAFRRAPLAHVIEHFPRINSILDYHADSIAVGGLAQRAQVTTLMLTHLGPPPRDETEEQGFSDDVRTGGYTGHVLVGRDLMSVTF